MAIDSRIKRASIASLGLAFFGASVVPDGSISDADRAVVAYGYYRAGDPVVIGIDIVVGITTAYDIKTAFEDRIEMGLN